MPTSMPSTVFATEADSKRCCARAAVLVALGEHGVALQHHEAGVRMRVEEGVEELVDLGRGRARA